MVSLFEKGGVAGERQGSALSGQRQMAEAVPARVESWPFGGARALVGGIH